MKRQKVSPNPRVDRLFRQRDTSEGRIERLQEEAVDPNRSMRDRLRALHELWQEELHSGIPGCRTPEIVRSFLELLAGEQDPSLRKEICFNTLGAVPPEDRRYLVGVLQSDPDAKVRAQAADTLQDLVEYPDVRFALEAASQSDSSKQVQEAASEMLRRHAEKND